MNVPYNAMSKILGGDKNTSKDVDHASSTDGSSEEKVVDQTINPAVQHEQVNKTHNEQIQKVVDKEKHQDHYRTTVQPLKEREALPEEHDYKTTATQERTFDHDDAAKTAKKLDKEQAQFKNTSTTAPTAQSKTSLGTVAGEEHVTHHYHETIQPVIEKETVAPSVTHTTVPIHEVHQEASVIHDTATAEPMSVEEFTKAGNSLKHTT